MTDWINLAAVGKIAFFGLLVGAALPGVFALAVRLNAAGSGVVGTSVGRSRRAVLTSLSWILIVAVVLIAVLGVLFIARDFIAAHTGLFLLGAKHH